jgi:hypothetical protein
MGRGERNKKGRHFSRSLSCDDSMEKIDSLTSSRLFDDFFMSPRDSILADFNKPSKKETMLPPSP